MLLRKVVVFPRYWGLAARLVAGAAAVHSPIRLCLMRCMLMIFLIEMFSQRSVSSKAVLMDSPDGDTDQ